jgi:hypothetical protein
MNARRRAGRRAAGTHAALKALLGYSYRLEARPVGAPPEPPYYFPRGLHHNKNISKLLRWRVLPVVGSFCFFGDRKKSGALAIHRFLILWHKGCLSSTRSATTRIDERTQLDWRGSSLRNQGLSQMQTGGVKSNRAALFFFFS